MNLDTTIKELYDWGQISVRTLNCLHEVGMETIGEVLNNIETPKDLLSIRKFGRKSYTEIEPILNKMIQIYVKPSSQTKEECFNALGERLVQIITDSYNVVTVGDSKVKDYLKAVYPQPCDFHFLITGDLENMLAVVEDFSKEENLAIRHSYKQFIEISMAEMESAQLAEMAIYAEYKRKNMDFAMRMENFSYEQVAKYFLSPIANKYLEKKYQEQVELRLSVRSKNFVHKFIPHFSDLIKYAEEPLASYSRMCPGQNMTKTLTEIFQFNQDFRREFDRASKLADDEIKTEYIKIDYPFLVRSQRQNVIDFINENGHAPLLFLMFHYLRLSENKSNKFYCLLHGIFDGKKRTLNEIADALKLSRERCRQIENGIIEAEESALAKNEDWIFYKKQFEVPFICEKTEVFFMLKDAESLPGDFEVFASIVSLVSDLKAENIMGHTILINKDFASLGFIKCHDKLKSIIDAKYSSDTYITIDSILLSVPEPLRPQMKELIKYVAEDIYNLQITDNGSLYLPQNYIDISEELYDILYRKGKPMHVEDIFNEFKRRYPDHKYSAPQQIKSFMYKHKHIKAVGKTSCYALDSWEGIYFGNIRSLLVDLLSVSDVPLHIDILYDSVTKHFQNTTKASIAATMVDEDLHRFVEFEGSYFGLTSKNYPNEYVVASTVKRYGFEERFLMFKDFVETYHRFPGNNGSVHESTLTNWYYHVTKGELTMTDEQKRLFDDAVKYYDGLGYPRSTKEHEFLIKCQDVKDYISQYHTLPTNGKAPELYTWLRRSIGNYDSYIDKRRLYMTDLLKYIRSLGFSL